MAHLNLILNEHDDGKYHLCGTCGSKTILIAAGGEWSVDQEPFCDGESNDDMTDDVTIQEEVTAHLCPKCRRITSLAFNS